MSTYATATIGAGLGGSGPGPSGSQGKGLTNSISVMFTPEEEMTIRTKLADFILNAKRTMSDEDYRNFKQACFTSST